MPQRRQQSAERRERPLALLRSYLASHRLQRDTVFGLMTTVGRALLVLFTTTVLVRALSEEELGRWSLLILFTAAGYLGMIDLGVHAPVTRRLTLDSQHLNLGMHHPLINWYRRVLLKALLGFSVFASGTLIVVYSRENDQTLGTLFVILLAINLWLVADTLILPIKALLEAREEIIRLRLVEFVLRMATLITTIVAVSIEKTALAVAVGSSLAAATTLGTAFLLVGRSRSGANEKRSALPPLEIARPSRSEWLGALLARLANTINWQVGRTIALLALGFTAAGQLEILIRLQALGVLLTAGLTGAIFPRLVAASTTDSQFGFVLARTVLIVTTALTSYSTFMILNGSLILSAYFGDSYQFLTEYLAYVMAAQVVIAICTTLEIGIVSQARDPVYAVTRWAFLLVNSGTTLYSAVRFGLIGVLIGTLIGALFNLLLLLFIYSRVLRIPLHSNVLQPAAIGVAGGGIGFVIPLISPAIDLGPLATLVISTLVVLGSAALTLRIGGVGSLSRHHALNSP